jgi:hypothetical protein
MLEEGTPPTPPLFISVFHKKLADYIEHFQTVQPQPPPRSKPPPGLTVKLCLSARVPQPCRDAADRCSNGAIHIRRVFTAALAAQHVYLNQVHGIDVGIAQLD